MDDEAMFKLDDVLAGIMRSRKAEKNGPGSHEVDPRFRALRLVQLFFCFPESDPLVVLPFLRSVIRIANERVPVSQRQRQTQIVDLCGRVLQCLKSRRKFDVAKIRAGTNQSDVAEVMQEIIAETGKVQNARLHKQSCEAVLFAQRVLLIFVGALKKTDAVKAIREIYLPELDQFATKKNCVFGQVLWNGLLSNLGKGFDTGSVDWLIDWLTERLSYAHAVFRSIDWLIRRRLSVNLIDWLIDWFILWTLLF